MSATFATIPENRVLRNTFALLATTLLPTALGVWLGLVSGFPAVVNAHPFIYIIGFIVLAFALLGLIGACSDSPIAIPILWVFTAVMGVTLSSIISVALKVDGGSLVCVAALGTAAVMAGSSLYAMTTERDFSSLGGFLAGALLALIIVSLLNLVFHLPGLSLVIAVVTLGLFSAYMIYDVQQVVNGGETNYVIATVQLYLNMLNIFSSLLQILLELGGDAFGAALDIDVDD